MSYREVNRKWLDRQYYNANITIVTALFNGDNTDIPHSVDVYAPDYVDKLYRGIARNFRGTFDFICLTDKNYKFEEPIIQKRLSMSVDQYGWMCVVDVYRPDLCVGKRLTIGLDTIITGPLDDILEHNTKIGLCTDPIVPEFVCNAITLASPEFCVELWDLWENNKKEIMETCIFEIFGVPSEMELLRKYYNDADRLDVLFPGRILSYKLHIRDEKIPVENTSIIYYHGLPKPHEMLNEKWVEENWV